MRAESEQNTPFNMMDRVSWAVVRWVRRNSTGNSFLAMDLARLMVGPPREGLTG